MAMPAAVKIDQQYQQDINYITHTQADGSNIGGVPPVRYGFAQGLPENPTGTLLFTQGSTVSGGYADWLLS